MRFVLLTVDVVEFVAMSMPFVDRGAAIAFAGEAILGQFRWLAAQAHRATHARDLALFVQQADHRVRGVAIELAGMSTLQTDHVAAVLNDGALHAQAYSKEWNLAFAREADCLQFAFDTAFAETAGYEDSVVTAQYALGPLAFDFRALNAADSDGHLMMNACVIDGFVDRLVGVFVLGILADHRDADFVFGIALAAQDFMQRFQIDLMRG